MNRRIRNRTYGGVRAGGCAPGYSISGTPRTAAPARDGSYQRQPITIGMYSVVCEVWTQW